MQSILKEKLLAYIISYNPELVLQLNAAYSMQQYLEDKVFSAMPLVSKYLGEGLPAYAIEELVLAEMTKDLRPSRFIYIRKVLETEFRQDFDRLLHHGLLTHELISLVGTCKDVFESFDFSEQTLHSDLLRHAVIAVIHDHLN